MKEVLIMIIESERLRIRPRTMEEMDKLYKAEQDEEMKKELLKQDMVQTKNIDVKDMQLKLFMP